MIALAANLLPDLIHGPADASTWLAKWWTMFIAPMASAEHRPGIWASAMIYNQSLIGGLSRWTITAWTMNDTFEVRTIEPLLSSQSLKLLIAAFALLLGGVSLIAMRSVRVLSEDRRTAWECSLVICGMLLFSPMSSPAHFGVLVLPAFLLARAALLGRSRSAAVFLIGMLIAAYVSNKDLLGAKLYSLGLWYGSIMAAAVFALIGCWIEMMLVATRSLRSGVS
jgi:hypothetical protein